MRTCFRLTSVLGLAGIRIGLVLSTLYASCLLLLNQNFTGYVFGLIVAVNYGVTAAGIVGGIMGILVGHTVRGLGHDLSRRRAALIGLLAGVFFVMLVVGTWWLVRRPDLLSLTWWVGLPATVFLPTCAWWGGRVYRGYERDPDGDGWLFVEHVLRWRAVSIVLGAQMLIAAVRVVSFVILDGESIRLDVIVAWFVVGGAMVVAGLLASNREAATASGQG